MSSAPPQKPINARELEALAEIKAWYKGGSYTSPYAWKPATMRKLEARGLVKQVGVLGGQPLWELTDLGRAV